MPTPTPVLAAPVPARPQLASAQPPPPAQLLVTEELPGMLWRTQARLTQQLTVTVQPPVDNGINSGLGGVVDFGDSAALRALQIADACPMGYEFADGFTNDASQSWSSLNDLQVRLDRSSPANFVLVSVGNSCLNGDFN